jgi:hypothetical protein
MESPILIDVWTVDSARGDELVAGISDALRTSFVGHAGFVSAQIYKSTNGTAVMLFLRTRTVEDRQRLMDSTEARRIYRELRAIASTHVHLYQLVESFGGEAPS